MCSGATSKVTIVKMSTIQCSCVSLWFSLLSSRERLAKRYWTWPSLMSIFRSDSLDCVSVIIFIIVARRPSLSGGRDGSRQNAWMYMVFPTSPSPVLSRSEIYDLVRLTLRYAALTRVQQPGMHERH